MYVKRVYTRIYLLSGSILSYTCMLFATYHLYRVKHYRYCSRYADLFTVKYRNPYFRDVNPSDIKTKSYMYMVLFSTYLSIKNKLKIYFFNIFL